MGNDAHPTLKALVDLEAVLKLPNFVSQLQSVKQCMVHTEKEADLILGVTHQLKGLEYTQEVGLDFRPVMLLTSVSGHSSARLLQCV